MKIKRSNKKISRRYILCFACLFLVSLHVFTFVRAFSSGATMQEIYSKEQKLKAENSEIARQLIIKSSLSKVEEEAPRLGFSKPLDTFYLEPEENVAKIP